MCSCTAGQPPDAATSSGRDAPAAQPPNQPYDLHGARPLNGDHQQRASSSGGILQQGHSQGGWDTKQVWLLPGQQRTGRRRLVPEWKQEAQPRPWQGQQSQQQAAHPAQLPQAKECPHCHGARRSPFVRQMACAVCGRAAAPARASGSLPQPSQGPAIEAAQPVLRRWLKPLAAKVKYQSATEQPQLQQVSVAALAWAAPEQDSSAEGSLVHRWLDGASPQPGGGRKPLTANQYSSRMRLNPAAQPPEARWAAHRPPEQASYVSAPQPISLRPLSLARAPCAQYCMGR